MLELYIIKYILNNNNYIKYRDYIKPNKDNKDICILYKILDTLQSTYARDISVDEYKISVVKDNPELISLVDEIDSLEIQDDMLSDLVKQAVNRSLAYDLAMIAIDVSEGRKELSEALEFVSKMDNKESVIEEVKFVTDSLEDLYQSAVHTPGLRWRLNSLNKSLGSLRKGDFGFLFARPETGKTTFLASEVTYFAEQTDRPILWINNEEQGSKVKIRCYQASMGCDLTELYSNRDLMYNRYIQLTKGNIKIYDSASISKRQVEKLLPELNPSLVVFDQIDKIKGFNSDREDLRLGSIYIWAREIAKEYCPVIGVCQADVTGENKKWLNMDNVANAKTSKQAEADWILGIGALHDEGLKYMRYLSISKNKLSGDEDSVPELRHGHFEVIIEPEIARYRDI